MHHRFFKLSQLNIISVGTIPLTTVSDNPRSKVQPPAVRRRPLMCQLTVTLLYRLSIHRWYVNFDA